MKRMYAFFCLLCLIIPIYSMFQPDDNDLQEKDLQENYGDWDFVKFEEPASDSCLGDEIDALHQKFLSHITERVNEIEINLKGCIDSEGSWYGKAQSAWSCTKWLMRKAETLAKNPTSEDDAQTLIDKILMAKGQEKHNDEVIIKCDSEVHRTMEDLTNRMSGLKESYQRSKSGSVTTQLAYLAEYAQRLEKVRRAFQADLKAE